MTLIDEEAQANRDYNRADSGSRAVVKAMQKQSEILDETHKIYKVIAFLTMMMIIFMGLQIAIDNLDWVWNPTLKGILFVANIVFIFVGVGGVFYLLIEPSNKKK